MMYNLFILLLFSSFLSLSSQLNINTIHVPKFTQVSIHVPKFTQVTIHVPKFTKVTIHFPKFTQVTIQYTCS